MFHLRKHLQTLLTNDQPIDCGWSRDSSALPNFLKSQEQPYFAEQAGAIKGTGRDKQVILWPLLEKVTGSPFQPHFQDIGDCVSHGTGLMVDTLTAVQIALHGKNERWINECSTEAIYAGSRVEIGGGRLRSDGSMGVWAGEWVKKYGVLLRGVYGDIDVREYRSDLAKSWGAPGRGVPDELEPIARQHPVQTVTLIQSWEECCDSIANGYPISVCSGVGFNTQRDSDGFLSRGHRPWYHCMGIWGIDSKSKREGGCIVNSWGANWVTGPEHKLGTPPGCFWADAKIIDTMLSQGDSIALSNFQGHPRQDLDYRLW
jgi:hypothetical protein